MKFRVSVGVHEAALLFLKRATIEGQTFESSEANVLRATKLGGVTLFTDDRPGGSYSTFRDGFTGR